MKLSAEHLEGLASKTGFRPETLEKVVRLGELAADVGRHPLLSRVLVLKGGTALNLMFCSPARLSVDLDFNHVGHEDRARMQEERPQVERALEIIGRGQGYQVQRSRDAHAGRKIYLSYTGAAGTRDRIEVDEAEREYIDRAHAGELRPELLFSDDAPLAEQLRRHPALLWKIENVKRHRSG